ncbi:hypothetical protein DE146DRAFT_750680 [Phaeosphaeria sp. MPI-PUGE-AT-0046c]|nr:hypothetical protein DE146DRAFT_750680 [Phaeosphaeria sp. MPI-PUGE-AT-0046c]
MRFTTIAAAIAAAVAIFASPLSSTKDFDEVAGSILTNSSVTYYMNHLYNIKTFADKGHNGFYPHPITASGKRLSARVGSLGTLRKR